VFLGREILGADDFRQQDGNIFRPEAGCDQSVYGIFGMRPVMVNPVNSSVLSHTSCSLMNRLLPLAKIELQACGQGIDRHMRAPDAAQRGYRHAVTAEIKHMKPSRYNG
jgi:hypothetical protein